MTCVASARIRNGAPKRVYLGCVFGWPPAKKTPPRWIVFGAPFGALADATQVEKKPETWSQKVRPENGHTFRHFSIRVHFGGGRKVATLFGSETDFFLTRWANFFRPSGQIFAPRDRDFQTADRLTFDSSRGHFSGHLWVSTFWLAALGCQPKSKCPKLH